jgi:hypothetical protein
MRRLIPTRGKRNPSCPVPHLPWGALSHDVEVHPTFWSFGLACRAAILDILGARQPLTPWDGICPPQPSCGVTMAASKGLAAVPHLDMQRATDAYGEAALEEL